jgi:hypothetical protein
MSLLIQLAYRLLVSSMDFFTREVVEHRWCGRGIHGRCCFSMVVRARLRSIIHRLMGCRLVTSKSSPNLFARPSGKRPSRHNMIESDQNRLAQSFPTLKSRLRMSGLIRQGH